MVRKYLKRNPLYPSSKLERAAFVKIVFYYCMGITAKRCAEKIGSSRQTVQNIYYSLGERVEYLMEGHYPSAETEMAGKILSLDLRKALKTMKQRHKLMESFFADDISYGEYQVYRSTGKIPEKAESEEDQFYRYNMFRTLHEFSSKTYGVNRNTYPRYFSFCKFQFLFGIVIIELSEAGIIDVDDEAINRERSMFCFEVLLLSLTQEPLIKPTKS